MMRRTATAPAWVMASCLLIAGSHAMAGGHFDVDDAGTLDPGQCQYEVWAGRTGGADPLRFQHVGPACRVGPVELGFNVDRAAVAGSGSAAFLGPQLKWTFFGSAADAPLSAALSAGAIFDVTNGGRSGGQFAVPLSWQAMPGLTVNANLGSDWATGTGARTGRGGVGAEWAVTDGVSLIAERHRAFTLWTSRVGLRFGLTPLMSIDVSAARTGPDGLRSVVVGLNHEFSRR